MLLQILVILVLCGAGAPLWFWLFRGRDLRFGWFFSALSGYLIQILVLEKLVYLNLPLRYTAWAALAVGLGGWGWFALRIVRLGFSGRVIRTEVIPVLIIGCVVFASQASGLIHAGTKWYYGTGHTDQLAFVTQAQFLMDERYSRTVESVRFDPWAFKAICMKGLRIAAVVAEGSLAVLSGSTAKESYGVQSVFFVVLAALCGFVALRSLSVPLVPASIAAVWIGILPGVTKVHLDGFFAQLSVLFVFPALAAVFLLRVASRVVGSFVLTVLLTYLFCSYTELYPLGAATVVALFVITLWPSFMRALIRAVVVTAASLLLSFPYLLKGFPLLSQHAAVSLAKPESLESLVPKAGTLRGWSILLFGDPAETSRFAALLTAVLLVLIVSAFFAVSLRRRLELAGLSSIAIAPLAAIVSLPGYPRYLFWKISGTFSWLIVTLVVIGMARALSLLKLRVSHRRSALTACLLVPVAFSAVGFRNQMQVVFSHSDNLSFLDTPGLRQTLEYVEHHPEETYLIAETNPIVAGWFMYHARKSRTYVDPSTLAGDYIPVGNYPFYQHPPALPRRAQELTRSGHTLVSQLLITVQNPQGIDQRGERCWYWMGDWIDLGIENAGAPVRAWLSLHVAPGPAYRVPDRVMAIDDGDRQQEFSFNKEDTIRTRIRLLSGPNTVRLRTVRPVEHQVRLSDDPRKHMIWVADISVREIEP